MPRDPSSSGIGLCHAKLIRVRGVVQGVGFRPFVYQLAQRHGLTGWVRNTSGCVEIAVEGDEKALTRFLRALESEAPPLAHIVEVAAQDHSVVGYTRFEILASEAEEGRYQPLSPDAATCSDCLQESFDPTDRRYRYPFINCTNCGPRFTIIEDIPYDRPRTTMRKFQMCPQCQAEYDDPKNRRFHAQPNACPRCGPQLEFRCNADRNALGSDPLEKAITALKEGQILAIKGLGGFHLACDAEDRQVVEVLRQRKHRYGKPLAVMVRDVQMAKRYCHVGREEEAALNSTRRPIVLLAKKQGCSIAPNVSPNNPRLGVMLPYTPLHHLLLADFAGPLVMTSGNLSEEPIAIDNSEALQRLSGIADGFLLHNRDICARYDDSVAQLRSGQEVLLRRARGFAPYPIQLPFRSSLQVLACGPHLKNTFCLLRDNYAFVSQHIGDLDSLETLRHFQHSLDLYCRLFRVSPTVVAHDLHPDYLSTRIALSFQELQPVAVQHHHAHLVSCMVENRLRGPVIGVAYDGLGYGADGHIWGGEIMVADWRGFRRAAHLRYVPMPGGEAAIVKPYRMALGYIFCLLSDHLDLFAPFLQRHDGREVDIVRKQVEKNLNSPLTSSCGRLFDAVSSLLAVRDVAVYEGQAAMELEAAASGPVEAGYPYTISEENGELIIDPTLALEALYRDFLQNVSPGLVSSKFHRTVAELTLEACQLIRAGTGINQVCLSGGVFQNDLLYHDLTALLAASGFEVYANSQVPCNDGGVSLGQAVVAWASMEKQ